MLKADIKIKAIQLAERYRLTKTEKYQWLIHFQIIAEMFQTRKADFTVNFTPGTFLNRDLYDATGVKAGNVAAGALLGMLFPDESQNFELVKSRSISDSKENRDYFNEISYRLHRDMNQVECGLSLTLNEYMRDQVFFGTCGVACFDPDYSQVNSECKFLFQPWDIKRMTIDEGPNGFVNCVYYEREETIKNAALEFGLANLSTKSREAYAKGEVAQQVKINILHAIEPRYERHPDGLSVFDMPVSSTYLELGENHILRESGYPRMPVFVGRLMKNIREKYGRSFAMESLPDVLELNALREMSIVAVEKLLDPPLGVLDDGRLGASTIDTSAGSVTVFNISGRIGNQPPVFPLNTVGDLKSTKERIEELKQSVSDHFMIDRLLDLNNETEMTAFEVNERQKLRAYVLNPLFSRQIAEVFSPLIHHCFNMELERGHLGVMPGSEPYIRAVLDGEPVLVIPPEIATAMLKGEQVYEIHYLTPAARMMKAQLASGIITGWKFLNDVAQTQPEIFDNVDEDMSAKLIFDYSGAPKDVIRSAEEMQKIRDARAKQAQQDKKFQQSIETMKAAGHLKGLAPQPGAPGVESASMAEPLQIR